MRLWPLFPLGSSGGTETSEAGPPSYAPPRDLRLGLAYEHEVRVWQFDGVNSLGALDHGLVNKAQGIDKIPARIVSTADGVAEGRIPVGTVVEALEAKAKDIAEHGGL